MKYNSPPRLQGLIFTTDEKARCLESGGILRASLEFGPACSLSCIYCYASSSPRNVKILSVEECTNIVKQLAEVDARSIVLLGGGETLLYPYWRKVVLCIRENNLTPIVFTNGQMLDEKAITTIQDAEASIVLKMDSLDVETQDLLSGTSGASRQILSAASLLLKQGFATNSNHRFAIHTVICKTNLRSLPKLWRWARNNEIIPLFQLVTSQGRGAAPSIHIKPEQAHNLFNELLEIDREEYGYRWEVQPPYVGDTCDKILYNLYIKYSGQISPCVGVDINLGNIRTNSIQEILSSRDMSRYRRIMKNIHGKCSVCVRAGKCYGCRGTTFAQTGDPFASDPSCWVKNGYDGSKFKNC